MRPCVFAITISLAGCTVGQIVLDSSSPMPDLPEPNYRQIVADNLARIIPNAADHGVLEISGVRPVNHLKGPAWMTCLRIGAATRPQHIAIFIQGDKIIDSGYAKVIDGCHREEFSLFDTTPTKRSPASGLGEPRTK